MQIAVEPYAECMDAIMALAQRHWQEVEWEAERAPLDVDQVNYLKLAACGALQTLVARADDGSVAGYALWLIGENPKHVGTLIGSNVVLYVRPDCRGHMLGPRIIAKSEAVLRGLGVKAMGICVKTKADFSPMLTRVGYEPTETIWMKWIGVSEAGGD